MFKKNLLIALRSFKKNKAITLIHILGLAVGLSASLVIFLIVKYDFSFDKWEPNHEQIYRVYTVIDKDMSNNGISLLAPAAIKQHIPGIEYLSHICEADMLDYAEILAADNKKQINEWGETVFADPAYFKMFPYKWLEGSPEVLTQLNSIVLSASQVKLFFPGQDYSSILGQPILFNDTLQYTVQGIVEDNLKQSDFTYMNFISLKSFTETPLFNNYGSIAWNASYGGSQCLVQLSAGTNPSQVSQSIKTLYQNHLKPNPTDFQSYGKLQPLSDVHFNTKIDGKANKGTLIYLGLLALALLILAAINFINLSTAQSSLRAREIGIRKVFGSSKKSIIIQFLTQTLLITTFATLLAIALTPFLIHIFNDYIPTGMQIGHMISLSLIIFIIVIILIVTCLAGLYPAFVLTKFKPVIALKNQSYAIGKSSPWLRQTLTVTQFVIAQVFLIVVLVTGRQIRYIMQKDLGFRKDAIITFYIPNGYQKNEAPRKTLFFSRLQQISNIQDISISSGPPTRNGWMMTSLTGLKNGKKVVYKNIHTRAIDNNYLSLYNIPLLAGRNIRVDTSSSISEIVINEQLMSAMHIEDPQKAIGQYLLNGSSDSSIIVGVLKNFATQSLHSPINPAFLVADNRPYGNVMSILLNTKHPESWQNTIAVIEKQYKSLYPNANFDYKFYDESIQDLYKKDRSMSSLLTWATGLSIFISCMGLLGLVSFMANQRKKEIGIRKVLGATVTSILALLSKHLIKLILIASIVSFPIAWYFANRWLEDFAFKTTIGWQVFLWAALGMLLIALLILWVRALGAARSNPIYSLKEE